MIIFRYLVREVYTALLVTTAILLLILISNQLIVYLDQVAAGQLSLHTMMQLMALQVPRLLSFLLPLGMYLGILLVYGRLYSDNEMTVFFACGISQARLLAMTFLYTVILALFVAILMLWIEPSIVRYRDEIVAKSIATASVDKLLPGRFQSVAGGKWVFYAQDLSQDHRHLGHVFAARQSDLVSEEGEGNRVWEVVSAQSAHLEDLGKNEGQFLMLHNGLRYQGVPGEKNYQLIQYEKYGVRAQIPSFLGGAKLKERALPSDVLWQQRHTNPAAAAELQWRVAMPISVLLLAMLAVPLSRVRPRQGRYGRLLPAILIYIVYANMIFVGRAWVKNTAVFEGFSIAWVHAAFFVLLLVLLLKQWGYRCYKQGCAIMNMRCTS